MDEPFIQTIDDAIRSSQTILAVIISGPNGEYAFERDSGTVITMVNNSPRFRHPFGVSNPPHYMPLRIEGQRNVSIQVATGYIDYPFCIGILKRILFVVLAALALAFFTLLLETLLVKNKTPKTVAQDEDEDADEDEGVKEEEIPEDDVADAGNAENEFNDEPLAEPPEQPEFATEERSDEGSPLEVAAGDPGDEDSPIEFAIEDDTPEPEPPAGPQEAEREPYSPRTHIGWEENTAGRLEAELHRCASYEQDLVFIAMELFTDGPSPSSIDDLYSQFAAETVDFFAQRDLIFERGRQGISIILPNLDLDQGFSNSKEFHNRVSGKAPYGVCIGLSSRSGRLIDAERLEFEAIQALKKALQDPVSPIVAFKSDPEKYREFIRSKNQS
jgi:hypothetical protein